MSTGVLGKIFGVSSLSSSLLTHNFRLLHSTSVPSSLSFDVPTHDLLPSLGHDWTQVRYTPYPIPGCPLSKK